MKKCICDDCHFRHYENGRPKEWRCVDGTTKPIGCINVGCDGWDHWREQHQPPEVCEEYVKEGEYKPSGIWGALGKVVGAVQEKIEEET